MNYLYMVFTPFSAGLFLFIDSSSVYIHQSLTSYLYPEYLSQLWLIISFFSCCPSISKTLNFNMLNLSF